MALFYSPGLGACCTLHFSLSIPIGSASVHCQWLPKGTRKTTSMIIPIRSDGHGGPCHFAPTPPHNRELSAPRQALGRVSHSMGPPSACTLQEPYPMARAGETGRRRRPNLAQCHNANSWCQLSVSRAGEATLEWGEQQVVISPAQCQNRDAAR